MIRPDEERAARKVLQQASDERKADAADFYDDEYDADEPEDEFECGAWFNGRFDYYHCQLAGTEDCDWECPHSATVRGLRK